MINFYKNTAKLDKLKDLIQPNSHDLEELLEIMRLGDELSVYFYENCKSGAWITLLKEAGEFEELGAPENKVGPRERLKANYLAEVAGGKPEEVLDIIGRIDAKDGFIQGGFLNALLKMPVDKAVLGLPTVKKYLEGRSVKEWYFIGRGAAQLMVAFAEEYANKAFEIAEELLEVWKPEEGEKIGLREIEAKFKPFEYEDLVFKYYNKLWGMYPFRAATVLVQIFERYLKELQEDKGYEVSSLFYISLERLDQIENIERDIIAVIVAGICEAGKVVIEKQKDKIDELLDYLKGLEKHIFKRIAMYLLRFVPAGTQRDRISEIIKDKKFLETPGYEYEYKLLLRDKFDEVPEARRVFEKWVDEQKVDDVDNWKEWFKKVREKEPAKEDFDRYEAGMKARALFLVKERYPELYEKYKKESELNDVELSPLRMVGEARWVSPMEGSPLSVEEINKMEPIEVIQYLCEPSKWKMDRKRGDFANTPEEGLVGTFKEVVKQKAANYADLSAADLMKLKPNFLSRYFYGLWEATREKKIEGSSLLKALGQAKNIIISKSSSAEYEECFKAILDVVGEIFGNEELKKKIVGSNKKLIWEIIEPLVKYEYNPDAIVGADTDPYTECINSVQGKAFELVVRFGIILNNEDGAVYEVEWSEKIVEILTYVLEEVTLEKVVCVFGVWLPQLYHLEEDWVKANVDEVFDDKKWDAVWGSYLSWGRINKRVFKFLSEHGKYEHAIEKLGRTKKYRHSKDPEKGLVEHLMIAFFNGWIGFEDVLLSKFLSKASAELRGHAASFLTTGFAPLKEKPDKETSARLKHYWERRLGVIGKNPEANMNEEVEFLGWVKDSPFEIGETFELLYKTLELTDGQLGEGGSIDDFMEGIYDIAKGHELMALRCMSKAMNDKHTAEYFSLYQEEATKFMKSIVELPDNYPNVEDIRKEAISLADAYGRRHIYQLRPIYEKLINKMGKNQTLE